MKASNGGKINRENTLTRRSLIVVYDQTERSIVTSGFTGGDILWVAAARPLPYTELGPVRSMSSEHGRSSRSDGRCIRLIAFLTVQPSLPPVVTIYHDTMPSSVLSIVQQHGLMWSTIVGHNIQ